MSETIVMLRPAFSGSWSRKAGQNVAVVSLPGASVENYCKNKNNIILPTRGASSGAA